MHDDKVVETLNSLAPDGDILEKFLDWAADEDSSQDILEEFVDWVCSMHLEDLS